jgi:hypothetical protein
MSRPVMSIGIECPMIRENDDLIKIVVESVLKSSHELNDLDIIGITESVVARSQGNYVTVDEVAQETERIFGHDATIMLYNPIYSRNRFAMILKGIARGASKLIITMPQKDEVGNVRNNHPFTGLNYDEYYKEIVESENCEYVILDDLQGGNDKNCFYSWMRNNQFNSWMRNDQGSQISGLDCTLHNNGFSSLNLHSWYRFHPVYTLHEYFKDKCEYGLLGSNKATEEKLKLFPSKKGAFEVCEGVKKAIKEKTGKDVIVVVYGDGCYKDASSEIWEFADPITMPGYTNPELIESTPNEIKLKALIDSSASDAEVRKGLKAKEKDLKGNMKSQGTTPRLCRDLLASLMDLTSGSGDRETPVVLVKGYF